MSTKTLKKKTLAVEAQVLPWQVKEAKETTVYHQSLRIRITKKIDGDKDHKKYEKDKKTDQTLLHNSLPFKVQADQFPSRSEETMANAWEKQASSTLSRQSKPCAQSQEQLFA